MISTMPKWIHDRAMSLKKDMEKTYGPEKAEQVAFAVATQQAHRLGKSPKTFKSKVTGKKETFGTPEGKEIAKAKFDKPKSEYKKTAAAQDSSIRRFMRRIGGIGLDEDRAAIDALKKAKDEAQASARAKGREYSEKATRQRKDKREAERARIISEYLVKDVPERLKEHREKWSRPEYQILLANPRRLGEIEGASLVDKAHKERFDSVKDLAKKHRDARDALRQAEETYSDKAFNRGVKATGVAAAVPVVAGTALGVNHMYNKNKTASEAMDTILETNEPTRGKQPHLYPQKDPVMNEVNKAELPPREGDYWKDIRQLFDNVGEKPTFQKEVKVSNVGSENPTTPTIKVAGTEQFLMDALAQMVY